MVAVIRLTSVLLYVVFELLYRFLNGVFSASRSSSSTCFYTLGVSTSSLECIALCVVISFLVLWFICFIFSLVHCKNGPEYLTKGTTLAFIPLINFLQYSFVSRSFLVILRFSLILSFISTCLMVPGSNISKYLQDSFYPSVYVFLI